MTIISLEDIRIHAFHGFYDEEQVVGNDYRIDVYLAVDADSAAKDDDLFATVNYELVYHICLSEMRKTKNSSKLWPNRWSTV